MARNRVVAATMTVILLAFTIECSARWVWDAQHASVDPRSKSLISTFLNRNLVNPNIAMYDFGVATATGHAQDQPYSVPLVDGGLLDDAIHIPLGTKPAQGSDGYLAVLDTVTGREHDFWVAKYDPYTRRIVSANSGVSFPANAPNVGVIPDGWGSNAANLPLGSSALRAEEIIAGQITHTMQFSVPLISDGPPRYPAIHTDGRESDSSLFVMGTWLRLNPRINVNKLKISRWEKIVARGLQRYGMILRDTGGSFSIFGRNPINEGKSWTKTGINRWGAFSKAFPWKYLQVLAPPQA